MPISVKRFSVRRQRRHAQRGAVLVVALIFLLLMTILALSASSRSFLQERMVGGLRNAQQAEMSAQTALRGAEWALWKNAGKPQGCGTGIITACYTYNAAVPIANVTNFRTKPGWIVAGATVYQGTGSGAPAFTALANGTLANNPVYMIEDLGRQRAPGVIGGLSESGAKSVKEPVMEIYRITARGSGGNANTVRVIETTFAVEQSK